MRFPADARRSAALLALLLLSSWLWTALHERHGRTALPDAAGLRFPCLSYAPFRARGHAPTDKDLIIPAPALERDLRQIAQVSDCVRIYGTGNGLDAVPDIARRLGLRVWLGAWVGSDTALSRREMERALHLAALHPDIVDRLVVGSEVLLRRELPLAALVALLDEARARSTVPVAYADVWEFWLRHADALRPHVDEAVIHILPYWEDQPVAVGAGVAHVVATFAKLRQQMAPLPVVIGETGWPAAGRMRGGARPGVVEQTRFLRELLLHLREQPLPLNVIEAYDQPWKVSLEGVAGASWGVFSADGAQRYRPAGAAAPHSPRWMINAAMAAGAAALLLLALRRGRTGPDAGSGWRGAIALAGGAALGALCLLQARELGLLPWMQAGWRLAALLASVTWAMAELLALAGASARMPAERPSSPGLALRALRITGLLGATLYALWLLLDGRYLDLAWPALAAPVIPFALQRLFGGRAPAPALEAIAALLALAALAVVAVEGWRNTAALAVALLMLLLAAGFKRSR